MTDFFPTVFRLFQTLWLLTKHGLAYFLVDRKGGADAGPERLRRFLEEVGGTYLKFGQVLSLQPDIIPREYCNALFSLLDRVPPFPFADVERTFIEDLGCKPSEMFDSFERTPMASASIGQVHMAWWKGHKVAVKVRRPSVPRVFSADLRLMGALAAAIHRFHIRKLFWMVRAINEFTAWTREELDYRVEARFMEALAYNAGGSPHEAVPRLFENFTSRRILVSEFLDGPTVLDYIRALEQGDESLKEVLRSSGFHPETFASRVVENFVSDAFHHGLFHADLHPANLLILPDNVVGYVDFGITGTLSHYSRRNMVALTLALTRADLDAMMTSFLKIAHLEEGADIAAFRSGLQDLIDKWCGGSGEKLLQENFTNVMLDMLELSRHTGVWPTGDVTRYIRSVITADGLVSRFASGLDVGKDLEQVCERYLKEQMWELWLSQENLADWVSAGLRLLSEGPAAATHLLQQITENGAPRSSTRKRNRSEQVRAQQLTLVVLAAVALLGLSDGPAELGMNFFTAEMFFAVTGAMMLVQTLRRLV